MPLKEKDCLLIVETPLAACTLLFARKTKEIFKDDFDYTDLSPHTVTSRVKGFHKRVKFIHSSQNLLSRDWDEGLARKWRTASMDLLN